MSQPIILSGTETITVVLEGKPHSVKRGDPAFADVSKAITENRWDDLPKLINKGAFLQKWSKDNFVFSENRITYKGEDVPSELYRRMLAMAEKGEDPTPFMKFYESLLKNPSKRSVDQLYGFLQHAGICIAPDGRFLAYKSVRGDFRDHHSGKFENKVGAKFQMERNRISDDPRSPCAEGFHVGALGYASNFGSGPKKMVICAVWPEHVVSVPYDESQQKVRVCEYEVVGMHGDILPSTSLGARDIPTYAAHRGYEEDYEDSSDKDSYDEDSYDDDSSGDYDGPDTESPQDDLTRMTIKELRQYATHEIKMVGASKLPGGKPALIAKIREIRGH